MFGRTRFRTVANAAVVEAYHHGDGVNFPYSAALHTGYHYFTDFSRRNRFNAIRRSTEKFSAALPWRIRA